MTVVLDASAVLALVQGEPGAEPVADVLRDAVMSTVNWAEVASKVRGATANRSEAKASDLRHDLCALGLRLVEFSAEHGDVAGELRRGTRELGLSLGDRACLALGIARNETVFTADRAWRRLRLGVAIEVIR